MIENQNSQSITYHQLGELSILPCIAYVLLQVPRLSVAKRLRFTIWHTISITIFTKIDNSEIIVLLPCSVSVRGHCWTSPRMTGEGDYWRTGMDPLVDEA
jgi:hypothetical protein